MLGGMAVGAFNLDIPATAYLARAHETMQVRHFVVGMVKAPVFGLIIAVAGCFQGMLVEADAEQVGKRTTSAVVQSIFLVIVLDAFFAVFFTWIGWI